MAVTAPLQTENARWLLEAINGGCWLVQQTDYARRFLHRWALMPDAEPVSGISVRALIARELIASTDGGATWRGR